MTFELKELEEGQSRLFMRVRAKDRSLPVRLKLFLARPMIKREWLRHFEVLKRHIREDMAHAEAASAPSGS